MELNLSEKYKPFPTDKVTRKVKSLDAEKAMGLAGDTDAEKAKHAKRRMKMDMAVYVDKDPELRSMHRSAKQTIERRNKNKYRKELEEFFLFWEEGMNVVPKPQISTDMSSTYQGPNDGNYDHPVAMKRAAIDAEMHQGSNPVEAHQEIHGDVDLGDTTSKRHLASTLGRVQDETTKRKVLVEPEKGSILARDVALEKEFDQTTHDDLRTPMRGEVPDRLQTPADQFSEEVEVQEEYDYNDDVSYLQKYGRA